MVFLQYTVSFEDCDVLGTCFDVDIKYLGDDEIEQTVGTMRCAVLDSLFVKRYKNNRLCFNKLLKFD